MTHLTLTPVGNGTGTANYNVALDSGIFVLIFAPMAIGIAVMSYKKRNQFRQNEGDRDLDLGW